MEELRRLNRIWLERTNPLRGLSISRATSMFDSARVWGSPRLQYAYNEIEATDPVLMTCVERRQSALAGLDYRFVASASADETLANEQRDALDRFVSGIENFSEALEHMDLAFFRGFAHVQPIWEGGRSGRGGMSGTGTKVSHINLLDSWNFLRNDEGEWLWNPACHETTGGLEPIGPDARLVSLVRKRAIDYPAIVIYIRHALGDRDWGRFIERYAIPPVHFEMAAGATDKDKPLYQEAGDAAHNGQNTIRPNGSHIDFAAEARGADPFTPFIEHQDKYIVLLATGGTLTSLAQADTGSLAGGAQMEVWREIVARDGVKIAEALNRSLFRRYLELEFPGRPIAARFELSNEAKQTADEIADLAGKLKTAGYLVDKTELEEKVGFKLTEQSAPTDPMSGGMSPGQISKLIYPLRAGGYAIDESVLDRTLGLKLQPVADPNAQPAAPIANKNAAPDGRYGPDMKHEQQPSAILAAFAADMSPAGKAVEELLKDPSKEAAEALLAKLDTLLPEDPATAAVIAEAMAAEFGAKVENKDDANGMRHSDANGQFDGGNGYAGDTNTRKEHKPATTDQVSAFQKNLPDKISAEDCDALLTAGFTDKDGDGNDVKYGALLRDHIDGNSHGPKDVKKRKERLGIAVRMVRESKPVPSNDPEKPNERVYMGHVKGKAYIAVADEHNEISAMEMVSYRRDRANDD